MRVGQTSFIHFLFNVLASILGFVATVYFARVLGADILGEYSLLLSIVIWLNLVVEAGIPTAITKRISEGTDQGEYATAGFVCIGALAVVFTVPVLVFGNWIDAYVGRQVHEFVVLLVIASSGFGLITSTLEGLQVVHLAGLLSPVRVTSRSLVQATLVTLGAGLVGLLVGYFVGSVLAIALGGIFVVHRLDLGLPERRHFERTFDFAKYAWIKSVGSRGFNWIDITILGVFVPASFVGIYSIAWNVASFLALFGNSIENTVFPEISNLLEDGDRAAAARLFGDSLRYAGLFVIPGLIGGYIIGEEILAIFGDEFRSGDHVLVLLVGAYLLFSYQRQFRNLIDASDRPDVTFRIVVLFLGMNTVLNIILVARYGWIGAAVATFAAMFLSTIHAYLAASRLLDFRLPIRSTLQQWAAAGVMGVILLVSIELSVVPQFSYPEIRTLLLVGLGSGAYFGSLVALSSTFRATVIQNVM